MLEQELNVARTAALAAAEAVRAIYLRDDVAHTEKADGKGPLTEADLAADRILTEALMAAFPDDGLLSEETTDNPSRLAKRRVWIIDPLDGTREFTEKIPEFVVSVGLTIDGKAALGVLVNPATGEVFTGVVGEGATYNGKPCTVTDHGTLQGARLLVSRSEMKKGWFDSYGDDVALRPCGSVAYKFGLVAAGLAEATFTPKPRNEWDLLGGVACVLAAGGASCDLTGDDYVFNRPDPLQHGVLGSNAALRDTVYGLMRDV